MGLDDIKLYMIGVILFVIVISSGVYMFGTFYASDTSLDQHGEISQFNKTLNKAVEITSSVNAIDESIQAVSADKVGPLGWLNALIGSVFNGLKALGSTLGFMNVAATESASIFGIPQFMVALILLIITVIIGFAIWSAIIRV